MKIEVHWLIDGIMSVEAETAEEAETLVAEQLTELVKQTPELKDKFGANAIQGQALNKPEDTADVLKGYFSHIAGIHCNKRLVKPA